MKILVPIDGAVCSMEALRFGAELTRRFDGTPHAVHITDVVVEATEEVLAYAETIAAEGIDAEPTVTFDVRLSRLKASTRVGKNVLRLVIDGGYDHIVMGHHGTGRIGRTVLGSAAETVVRGAESPVTTVSSSAD